MKTNVGGVDRMLRIVVGLAVLSLVVILDGPGRWWGLIGLVPVVTGILRWCPAYTLFGLNSCPLDRKHA